VIKITIPGRAEYEIEHVVLDLNGTIGLDGGLLDGVATRLSRLGEEAHLTLATADTHGGASHLGHALGLDTVLLEAAGQAEQKLGVVRRLGVERTVAIGNGANDTLMLKESAIGICVIGGEGAATEAVFAADVVVNDILEALDLLLKPTRLVATLRV
jgi:P-type E1-E2 ATPase